MRFSILLTLAITFCFNTVTVQSQQATEHPRLFAKTSDRTALKQKIETEDWAKASFNTLVEEITPYVDRHTTDPEWIVSRLAMYWKDGERYTQCYIKGQDWDYGEGNAPMPTVRLPGMRKWNDYVNVPLEDRIPYNESGDMLGISRSKADKTPVKIPYKETGHMIRANNMEILKLAEKSAFAYYMTQEEKYAKFSADIYWTWILGTYYMNPPLDPEQSTKGSGGYEPGGIMGYYDYEVIHDDRQIPMAATYDFLYDYLKANPHKHLKEINKTTVDVSSEVFKRFIEIGLVRGGKKGNWNVNRYKNIIGSMLVLESNDFYDDGKGREYYIPFYTEKSGEHYAGLPEIMANYDTETGLWPESPGYASGMIPTVLEMGLQLYKSSVNTLAGNPIIEKAALANLGWLDARGNLVVFGDMRGGAFNMSAFESLLTYSTWKGDDITAKTMATVIKKNIENGQYNRNKSNWQDIIFNQALPESGSELPYHRSAYSKFHRHMILRNGNDEDNGLMFTLYGGRYQSHLAENGLAMQFYGKGWALAPDASAYESYWSPDAGYHRGITGSNTIVPGYKKGEITINAMDPKTVEDGFYNTEVTSEQVSFADVSADEKRRVVAMIRTSETTGYYVDVFRSDQDNNDYIHHNLGHQVRLTSAEQKPLEVKSVNDLGTEYNKNYSFFKNQRKIKYTSDFNATWDINTVSPELHVNMWMQGQDNRELYVVDAPPTTLREDITPGQINKSPQTTPTLIVRQNGINAKSHPFVSVFESYETGQKSIHNISKVGQFVDLAALKIESKNSTQIICSAIDSNKAFQPEKGMTFKGTLGVVSEKNGIFEYLYLGEGTTLTHGNYSIESEGATVTATLKLENGTYYYSANQPVKIKLKKGKAKTYPAGYNVEIK
ncbi:chondroitin AC/alginate lyase family protein (PL 8) [Formosa agariphila KMM 3901]|uniref:Chondroitin AC/alginate lyase family protein (PL 8) n=1 Tax=Formosa agariphila (strain DSM 15362 / KCTC 12365 / LMG 23005 / KMM 3901 / M-2Alg 35-1) TaxID=1347342 RepID=T2KIM4_FORAG|nr:hypothetical protein [Formosa agariphila]CDF78737.1 chondroitin AC/alginate lyase family protein (PL 8) [Formosa agariphila KMM 3901]